MELSKPKILVYGHTWVRSLGKLHDSLDLSNLIVHYEGRPNASIDFLLSDVENVLKEEYDHMMLFTLISEMYGNEKLSEKNGDGEYWIKYPKTNFSFIEFVPKLENFIKKCEELCPNIKVHLMIPPPLDLNHYNTIQLRNAPLDVKIAYSQNIKYKPSKIMNDILDFGIQIKGINIPSTRPWYKKETFSVHNAVQNIQITGIKTTMLSYVLRKSNTMGKNSYLIDGFHPSSVLISKMWKLFIQIKNIVSKKRKLFQLAIPPVQKVSPLKSGSEIKKEIKVEGKNGSSSEKEVSNDAITSTATDDHKESSASSSDDKESSESSSDHKESSALSSDTAKISEMSTRYSMGSALTFPTNNKKPKLSTDAEFESFVGTETERLIYYLYGYASGKGINCTTEDVAFYVSKYLVNRK